MSTITSTTKVPATTNAEEAVVIASFKDIVTERLVLRSWKDNDTHAICEIMQDSEVNRYLSPHNLDKLSTIEAISKKSICNIREKGYGYFVCEEKSTGKVIGMIGLNYTQIESRHFPCYTISWILGREFWKQGYAIEAAQAIKEYAFNTCKIPKIYACTVVDNQASRKIMERIGMQYVETFSFPGIEASNPCCPHVLYELSNCST
ncbi:MAG: GNAT family N-acetyltransferase [Chlamydiales bacterium]|nr:GNAT family N-acetyltransferase [Chlamydiales bacterium]